MSPQAQGLAHSVQERLVAHAKAIGVEPNLMLTRFATERLLYRLSRSPHGDRFVLKGALLMLVWLGETIRPTRDADLLGFGDLSDGSLVTVFEEVCGIEVEPDAVILLADSIRVTAIRPEDAYGGKRITIQARLGRARLRLQVDVGIGDAVYPEPRWLEYPSLLGLPAARLRAYCPETAIAEKLHAMVALGSRNSRMRDFFDVYALAQRESFDGHRLAQAIRTTFDRRRTQPPGDLPLALTSEFAASREKQTQWRAFLRKSGLTTASENLGPVVERLAVFLGPAIAAAHRNVRLDATWQPGGPWVPTEDLRA